MMATIMETIRAMFGNTDGNMDANTKTVMTRQMKIMITTVIVTILYL